MLLAGARAISGLVDAERDLVDAERILPAVERLGEVATAVALEVGAAAAAAAAATGASSSSTTSLPAGAEGPAGRQYVRERIDRLKYVATASKGSSGLR